MFNKISTYFRYALSYPNTTPLFLCPWTAQEVDNATAVSYKTVQAVSFSVLVFLPSLKRLQEILILHDEIKVKAKEDGHPCLRELIVASRYQPARQSPDEVQELV